MIKLTNFLKKIFSVKPVVVEQPRCPVMHQPLPPREEPKPVVITPTPAPVAVKEEIKVEVKPEVKDSEWPFPSGVKPGEESKPVAAMTAKPKPKSTGKKPATTRTRKKK
ncbi:MAG: hypothetical protein ACO294_07555 [Methylococcales bacterium]